MSRATNMSEEPITVDCQITSQKFDFDYDLDNTLEMFISDLQDQEPPMGFKPISTDVKSNATEGVFIAGNAYPYAGNSQATLSSLGATTNSIIMVSSDVTQA